ncbi:isocitrate/isopropylmalate dehydrogenase domain-containing protein [Ditylenchus destructor]|uniref:Isocitrate/isopropylmalate dehydrogenase domain-containing protein n=1 Tax=Ditylenchus destructor TaxID=166010 RepID=A0AAD4R7F9_9BILA|nr:isocitrate/isopropylmalate dehydrogenase domain-containing protein [Ditylenchus destructor]
MAAAKQLPKELLKFRSKICPNTYARSARARYGGRQMISVMPGDGIGPEMIGHLERIFTFAHIPVDFEMLPLSSQQTNVEDLDYAITSIKRNGVALKGNIETKFDDPQFKSRNMQLRRILELYANVVHAVTIPTVPSKHKDIDIVMIRENTEGEYSGLEHETQPGIVESLKIVTREKIERIARFAFNYAIRYDRKKVTAVHKANIQKLGDGLFLNIATEMAKNEYPQIEFDSMIVDNASMQLVCFGFRGLLYNLFHSQGTRNTGTTLAGKDVANPTAFIRAAVDMLKYLQLDDYADILSDALFTALTEQRMHTPDLGGTHKTSEVIEAVLENLQKQMK